MFFFFYRLYLVMDCIFVRTPTKQAQVVCTLQQVSERPLLARQTELISMERASHFPGGSGKLDM